MNKLIAVILIIILNLGLSQFLPWWNFIPAVIMTTILLKLDSFSSWFLPAISLMALWTIQIIFLDQKTGFRTSSRVADIFEAPAIISYLIPILGIGLIAAVCGKIGFLLRTSMTDKSVARISEMNLDDYQETQPDLNDKGII